MAHRLPGSSTGRGPGVSIPSKLHSDPWSLPSQPPARLPPCTLAERGLRSCKALAGLSPSAVQKLLGAMAPRRVQEGGVLFPGPSLDPDCLQVVETGVAHWVFDRAAATHPPATLHICGAGR